jgi:hypothetical protein
MFDQEEASRGRQKLSDSPSNLTIQSQRDPNIRPPYTWDNLQETARHRTIMDIYHSASFQTKQIYDLGHYNNGLNEENWIIKWLLWHVFRYRDNRNRDSRERKRSVRSPGHDSSDGRSVIETVEYSPTCTSIHAISQQPTNTYLGR